MPNAEHVEILRKGVVCWNRWRADTTLTRPQLSSADLSGLELKGANLTAADLSRSNLTGANLLKTSLVGADLQFANLEGARGLKRLIWSQARNIILARYSLESLSDLNLPSDHNQRLEKRDLSEDLSE